MAQKRKSDVSQAENNKKKRKNWQTPKQAQWSKDKEVHTGDTGIWATCERHKEGKCISELTDLLEEYASKLYEDVSTTKADGEDNTDDEASLDIEDAISSEISTIKKAKSASLFKVIRIDMECVLFVKTYKPVDPVVLVHHLCKDIAAGLVSKNYRYIKRLTPATWTEKAHEKNFTDLATRVLEPAFHGVDAASKKFAIRYTSRNHHILTREDVIKKTAALVGDQHKVDLENPDLIILIEAYKTICTMAVVDGEYLALKRYNLAELANPAAGQEGDNVSTRITKDANATLMQNENLKSIEQKETNSSEIGNL